MVLPLQGTRVVDMSEEIAGPYSSMQLGDFGADIIKVEPLGGDWARSLGAKVKGESALFLALNRNKKSLAVDVENDRGKKIVQQLVREADVFLEAFRPGQADELGVGYEDMSRINPGLVYCSISAFGSSGPYRDRAASELEIQGMALYQWHLGEPGGAPVRLGADAASVSAGQSAFAGILAALYYRKKTGIGQKVETSLLSALIKYGCPIYATSYDPESWSGMLTAPYDHPETGYKTKDRPLFFGNFDLGRRGGEAWINFCKGVGLNELLEDSFFREWGMRMVGMGRDAQEWKPVIEQAFEDKTAEELKEIIETAGGYAGILKTYEDVFNEPQVDAVEMVQEIEHPVAGKIRVTGIPYKLADTPGKIRTPPPTLGQHTDEILTGLGYSREEITALRQAKVVA
jgi:crotonobetainyl-CoA:carnitine CoA-transferase CaiB-like acyl-CoA transferase